MHGRDEKFIHFMWKARKGRDHSEDLGIDESIILKWIFGK